MLHMVENSTTGKRDPRKQIFPPPLEKTTDNERRKKERRGKGGKRGAGPEVK